MKARHRHIILIVLLAFVLAARFSVEIGEWYSIVIYPVISGFLSYAVSWIPFSLEEIVVVGAVLLLIFIIVNGIRKRRGFVNILFLAFEFLLWIYIWFYIGWGCNYYRESIYTRLGVGKHSMPIRVLVKKRDKAAAEELINE